MRRQTAILAVLMTTACVDSHRHFDGPLAPRLWEVRNLSGFPLAVQDGVLYLRGYEADAEKSEVVHLYAFEVQSGKRLWKSEFVPDYPDSIAFAAGSVYVIGYPSGTEKTITRRLHALDAKSGQQSWESSFVADRLLFVLASQICVTEGKVTHTLDAKTGKSTKNEALSYTLRRASVVDGVAYAMGSDATVRAMDSPLHTLWSAKLPNTEFRGPLVTSNAVYYYCISAEEAKGCLTPTGEILPEWGIYAFDRTTGVLRWKWGSDEYRFSGMEADADTVYVSAYRDSGVALALDAGTGKPRWSHPLKWNRKDYFFRTSYPHPLFYDSNTVIFFDQPSNELPSFDGDQLDNKKLGTVVHAYQRRSGDPLWESKLRWKYEKWATQDGLLFAVDGGPHGWRTRNYKHSPDSWFTLLDLRTGQEEWRSDVSPLATYSPPMVADGVVVVASLPTRENETADPEVFAFRARREPYTK